MSRFSLPEACANKYSEFWEPWFELLEPHIFGKTGALKKWPSFQKHISNRKNCHCYKINLNTKIFQQIIKLTLLLNYYFMHFFKFNPLD